jgi:hypothetical protein
MADGKKYKGGGRKKLKLNKDKAEPLLENFLEFFDPTGLLSYGDAQRAYKAYNKGEVGGLTLAVEAAGALPIVGKVPKTISAAANALRTYAKAKRPLTAVNRGDAVQDMNEDNFSKNRPKAAKRKPVKRKPVKRKPAKKTILKPAKKKAVKKKPAKRIAKRKY